MTQGIDERPFAMTVVKHATTASGITMISRAPWPAPTNKYYVLRKVVATVNAVGSATASGTTNINIWDQDLSSTTPVGRGSGALPLLSLALTVPTSGTSNVSTATLDLNTCPREYFQAGLTVGHNMSGSCYISAELDVV